MRSLSLARVVVQLAALCWAVDAALPAWTPPLSTRGRYIVDANGNRFRLRSGNWHGASGTWEGSGDVNDDTKHHIGQNSHTLPLGLQYIPINTILDLFESYGINSIRFPFSNEMIRDTTIVQDAWVAANPQFKGMTPLQVYDAVIAALTQRGFAVIINNHTNKSRWCCGVNDGNERWNESQSYDQWVADWVTMVQRYKSNQRVVGADLYNEVSSTWKTRGLIVTAIFRFVGTFSMIPNGEIVAATTGSPRRKEQVIRYCWQIPISSL